jgi:hypothetical protein
MTKRTKDRPFGVEVMDPDSVPPPTSPNPQQNVQLSKRISVHTALNLAGY